jgi:hypothetical protein
MICCICAARGKYVKADPTIEGIPQCRLHFLESNWRGRTDPVPFGDLTNPLARYAFTTGRSPLMSGAEP